MTVKAFYAQLTGDTATHQRRIDGALRRLDERRARMIRRRAEGASVRTIAAEEGISAGAADDAIKRGVERIRKELAGEPRYNQVGRATKYGGKRGPVATA